MRSPLSLVWYGIAALPSILSLYSLSLAVLLTGVPPKTLKRVFPSLASKQLSCSVYSGFTVTLSVSGSPIVNSMISKPVAVVLPFSKISLGRHPFSSCTITKYLPGAKLSITPPGLSKKRSKRGEIA